MKFEVPQQQQLSHSSSAAVKKSFRFDPEEPLPDNVLECDDLIASLLEIGDMENYERVAQYTNDMVGWLRYETINPSKKKKHGKSTSNTVASGA